jgi:hypothetical protein
MSHVGYATLLCQGLTSSTPCLFRFKRLTRRPPPPPFQPARRLQPPAPPYQIEKWGTARRQPEPITMTLSILDLLSRRGSTRDRKIGTRQLSLS